MDDTERLYQGQFWLVSQLCFARYEAAILRGLPHTEAYEVAQNTLESYIEIVEQSDSELGDKLIGSVTRLLNILIASVGQNN